MAAFTPTKAGPLSVRELFHWAHRNMVDMGAQADAGQFSGDSINVATSKTPASSGASGAAGDIAWDADYIYVCVATDTWKRAALSTW